MGEVTWVEDDICVCDNCGAHAVTEAEIQHHKTCTPGESKKWEKFYAAANEYRVRNFTYNGFMGQTDPGHTDYTATFKEWTSDPGIATCDCSDGVERNIPTFALEGFSVKNVPEQPKTGVLFGPSCES